MKFRYIENVSMFYSHIFPICLKTENPLYCYPGLKLDFDVLHNLLKTKQKENVLTNYISSKALKLVLVSINFAHVWLQAPKSMHVKLQADVLHLPYNPNDNKCYHWLEIRYNLVGQTGIRYIIIILGQSYLFQL